MRNLGLVVCLLVLAGCNQSDNSVGEKSRISSAMLPSAGHAKVDDGPVLQEPVLENRFDNLESVKTATILNLITSKATSDRGVRLIFLPTSGGGLPGSGPSNAASLAELDHAIRADKAPNLIWTEITIGDCDAAADCRETIERQ